MRKTTKIIESAADARSYLFDLLARRDYTRAQLVQKLMQRGCDPVIATSVLDSLESDGYQSDRRFVESQVRQRTEQGQGKRKIEFELRNKGVDNALIQEVLDSENVDPKRVALDYFKRRYGESVAQTQNEKAKRMRHMASRGFSYDEINYAQRYQIDDPEEF